LHGYYIHSGDEKERNTAEGDASYLQKMLKSDRKKGFVGEDDFTYKILLPLSTRLIFNEIDELDKPKKGK